MRTVHHQDEQFPPVYARRAPLETKRARPERSPFTTTSHVDCCRDSSVSDYAALASVVVLAETSLAPSGDALLADGVATGAIGETPCAIGDAPCATGEAV
jgi:hypothetical protein